MTAPTRTDSRSRVQDALAHREPDRVPRDLGSTRATGIHVRAYQDLRQALGLPETETRLLDFHQQLAEIEDDVVDALDIDVRGVSPSSVHPTGRRDLIVDDLGTTYLDEWQVLRRMPRDGYYFDSVAAPLSGSIDIKTIDAFPWPDAGDPARYEGLSDRARRIACDERRAVHVNPICSGLIEGLFKLRGFEDAYMDLAADQHIARRIMEHLLEVKLGYWERALPLVEPWIDIAGESDDLGGQRSLLFSPTTYRDLVKPLHAELISYIHSHSNAKVFFHSCGAIREIIPDLIDIGVEILNPVQITAEGMAASALKRDFGRDLVFWGGGVDTQGALWSGTPREVRDDVRRNVRDLMPGGGFVFAAVHNIQANVPPPNLLAMWEELDASGSYSS